jgi:hypothetical protein
VPPVYEAFLILYELQGDRGLVTKAAWVFTDFHRISPKCLLHQNKQTLLPVFFWLPCDHILPTDVEKTSQFSLLMDCNYLIPIPDHLAFFMK